MKKLFQVNKYVNNYLILLVVTFLCLLSGCSSSSPSSISKTSIGPSLTSGYFCYAEINPSIQAVKSMSVITVTVTNAAGNPVSGVTVIFTGGLALDASSATTNANGIATVNAIAAEGRHAVDVHVEELIQTVYLLGQ